jgi:hypothetical protein
LTGWPKPWLSRHRVSVRGKILSEIISEQLPRAVQVALDLAADGNYILRETDRDALVLCSEQAEVDVQAAACRIPNLHRL